MRRGILYALVVVCLAACINTDRNSPCNAGTDDVVVDGVTLGHDGSRLGCEAGTDAVVGDAVNVMCMPPQIACGRRCVDTMTDTANCGVCGNNCPGDIGSTGVGQVCENGRCVATQRSCRTPDERKCGMVAIRGGTFWIGGRRGLVGVNVSSFALDAYEVTVARFRVFWAARMVDGGEAIRAQPIRYPNDAGIAWGANAGNEPARQNSSDASVGGQNYNWSQTPSSPSRELHPINGVTWWTAQEFCRWDGGRLPTEAEWEYAAQGRDVDGLRPLRLYPWGDQAPGWEPPMCTMNCRCLRAQIVFCGGEDGTSTRRVGSFSPTGGLFDLAGNLWEWTADWYVPYPVPDAGSSCWGGVIPSNPLCTDGINNGRTTRGGAWNNYPADVTSVNRIGQNPGGTFQNVGFRCARTLTE